MTGELLHTKTQLIAQYLVPVMGSLPASMSVELIQRLVIGTQLRQAIARQYLDEPGPADEGLALVLPQSISHSVQAIEDVGGVRLVGTHIWHRRTLIFDPFALLDGTVRRDSIQALEPGPYLSIRYPVLRQLITDYPLVDRALSVLARRQENQRQQHDHLLHLTPAARVAAFETLYKSFARVATIEQRSLHIGLTRQTYSKKLKIVNS